MTTSTTAPTRTVSEQHAAASDRREHASRSSVWFTLLRHHLRLLRGGAIAWILALTTVSVGVVATFEDRYTTQAELDAFAELEGVPAFEAMLGRLVGLNTLEGGVLSRWGMFGILAAVWGMFAAVRLLRGAEEAGHLEKLRAGAVTPRGLLSAVVAALLTTHLLLALAIGVTHSAAGMDPATSWALGGAVALLTACFAAASVLASQLVSTRRRAVGIVGTALGLSLVLRLIAAASGSPDWVWWTTPLGWLGFLHEVDGAQLTVLGAYTLLLVVLLAAAFLLARRDLHAGWIGSSDDTPRRAVRPVRGQASLARRLTVASSRTWAVVLGLLALAFGMLARDFSEAVADMPTMVELADAVGWVAIDTPEGIVAYTFTIIALLLAVFAVGQAVAIREEEASWRIEHLMVRPLSRITWLTTRIVHSLAAVVLLALVAGVGAWAGTALVGTPVSLIDALAAGLNTVSVAWLAFGLAIALVGVVPRLTAPLSYGLVLGFYLIDFVGGMLELPEAVLELSPFAHLASVPVVDVNLAATGVSLAVAAVGIVVGLVAFRRRDLQEA